MKKSILGMAVLVSLCLGSLAQANITIDTVAVGNAGNAADTHRLRLGGLQLQHRQV